MIPPNIIQDINSPPILRRCIICGAELEWNPVHQEWANHAGGNRHYCSDEAIQALIPDVHECINCGCVVLVFRDGRRLNQDLRPHQCKPRKRRVKQSPRKKPTQRHRGAVEI